MFYVVKFVFDQTDREKHTGSFIGIVEACEPEAALALMQKTLRLRSAKMFGGKAPTKVFVENIIEVSAIPESGIVCLYENRSELHEGVSMHVNIFGADGEPGDVEGVQGFGWRAHDAPDPGDGPNVLEAFLNFNEQRKRNTAGAQTLKTNRRAK